MTTRKWTTSAREVAPSKMTYELLKPLEEQGGWEFCVLGNGHIMCRHAAGPQHVVSGSGQRRNPGDKAWVKRAMKAAETAKKESE